MDAASLTRALTTRRLGQPVVHRDVVASTNDLATEALRADQAPHGAAFVASRQVRGRGTDGTRWHSSPEGLWCSLVLRGPVPANPLSFLPGVALVDALREDHGIDAHVKWPNDVLVGRRKISGTLIEVHGSTPETLTWVVGIGVNVNQQRFPDDIVDRAVSMRMVTGWSYRIEEVFAGLMARLEAHLDGTADLVAAWRQRTRMLGRRVLARRSGATFGATVLDVSNEGHLQVVLDDGTRQEWVATVDLDIAFEDSWPDQDGDGRVSSGQTGPTR